MGSKSSVPNNPSVTKCADVVKIAQGPYVQFRIEKESALLFLCTGMLADGSMNDENADQSMLK